MKIATRLLCGAALLCVLGAAPAVAGPVNWTLNGVTFDDGGTAAGSFTYDADTNEISAWSISTDGGWVLSPYTYDTSGYGFDLGPNDFIFVSPSFDRYIRLGTASALTNAGGTLSLLTGFSSYECTNCGTFRLVTGGSLVAQSGAVPEPAAWALMLVGFGATGIALRRHKVRTTVSYA